VKPIEPEAKLYRSLMMPEEWKELESLDEKLNPYRYDFLLVKTEWELEHPEDYNGPCFCAECMRDA
jgi:hypothetical protein